MTVVSWIWKSINYCTQSTYFNVQLWSNYAVSGNIDKGSLITQLFTSWIPYVIEWLMLMIMTVVGTKLLHEYLNSILYFAIPLDGCLLYSVCPLKEDFCYIMLLCQFFRNWIFHPWGKCPKNAETFMSWGWLDGAPKKRCQILTI